MIGDPFSSFVLFVLWVSCICVFFLVAFACVLSEFLNILLVYFNLLVLVAFYNPMGCIRNIYDLASLVCSLLLFSCFLIFVIVIMFIVS